MQRFTLRYGPTVQIKSPSATAWIDCRICSAVRNPPEDCSRIEVQLCRRLCISAEVDAHPTWREAYECQPSAVYDLGTGLGDRPRCFRSDSTVPTNCVVLPRCKNRLFTPWFCSVAPKRNWKWGQRSGAKVGAKRRKFFFGRAPPLCDSKSTISHFGERFRDVPPVSNHL